MSVTPFRVVVEGCGHGTLHAIYASVEHACAVKGWDTIDLLIIGGDFQAVRNNYDLNVTAMPHKYRQMADFHEYYSGVKVAPYLTIFIGGNHEASNHLFELYYGGWVAPNIYYMGAANVLRLGPVRIAGLSGIWKGYDYRKPHFERLPYSKDDITSIFHVRELDVRKLLSIRTQVDIGLSHDWPQGIEWHGDHKWLFNKRKDFYQDAQNKKLGSVAARQCLERLRPPHWFSAHLHTKYVAVVRHGEYARVDQKNRRYEEADQVQVSAWKNFHTQAQQRDNEERDRAILDLQDQRAEENRIGIRSGPNYTLSETWKKVSTTEGLSREVTSISSQEIETVENRVSNLDGCGKSLPVSLKRRRETTDGNGNHFPNSIKESSITNQTGTLVEPERPDTSTSSTAVGNSLLDNPDAIEIDMSDEDEEIMDSSKPNGIKPTSEISKNGAKDDFLAMPDSQSHPASEEGQTTRSMFTDNSEQGNRHHDSPRSQQPLIIMNVGLEHEMASSMPIENDSAELKAKIPAEASNYQETENALTKENEISDDLRAQLADLSTNFVTPARTETSPALPLPAGISNTTTRFLALGKCEKFQEFLQLLQIEPFFEDSKSTYQRPLKLHYDPEWLAILRVFSTELSLGGKLDDKVPPNRGDTYYRDHIIQEEQWVKEHVLDKDLLQIPENFTITAPIYNPKIRVAPDDMPREYTNPQTSAFCDLIDIVNPFDISEEERNARFAAGPPIERTSYDSGRGSRGRVNHRGGTNRGGHRGGGRGKERRGH